MYKPKLGKPKLENYTYLQDALISKHKRSLFFLFFIKMVFANFHFLCAGYRDCRLGVWSEWSACSVSCGIGEMQRRREVIKHPRGAGRQCPPLLQTKWCGSAKDCPPQTYFEW